MRDLQGNVIFALHSPKSLISPASPIGEIKWYNRRMKRATMTLPDDLAKAVDEYVRAQEAPPPLTAVVQAALREYLRERGFLRQYRPLKITPAPRGSGRSDVSVNHDRYFAEGEK